MSRLVVASCLPPLVAVGCNLLAGPDYYIADNYYATTAVGSGGATGAAAGVTNGSNASASGGGDCDKSKCAPPKDPRCGAITCDGHGACTTVNFPVDKECKGDPIFPVCDGKGGCVMCTATHPCSPTLHCNAEGNCVVCLEDAHCTTPGAMACDIGAGACVECTQDTHCASNAAHPRCDVVEKACVECLDNGDCKGGLVCNGNACKTPHCKNLVKDLDETDVDCGGSCSPCAFGKTCVGDGDCSTGHCSGAKACECTDQGQCPATQYCDVDQKACVNLLKAGNDCDHGYQCPSASCKTSWSCWFHPCCQ